MVPNVTLIVGPQIDWPRVAVETKKLPTQPIMPMNTWSNWADLLMFFDKLKYRGSTTNDFMDHLFFTFLIEVPLNVDCETPLFFFSRFKIISSKTVNDTHLMIVSGTLKQWLEFTFDMSVPYRDYELRLVANKVFIILQEAGFGLLWKNAKKISQPDQTFLLER